MQKGDSEKISEAIKSHIDPIPDFKLSFAKCEDKEFVVLNVMPSAQTPYYYIGDEMQACKIASTLWQDTTEGVSIEVLWYKLN